MAGSSFFALLDDIATILDDVAVMSKVAAKKTAGVLGDDLALNAQQVTGIQAERELPVVWVVAVGSTKNKVILVPAALAISAFLPWAITPLLMVGGGFLCYEGVEKLAHKFLHSEVEEEKHHQEIVDALANPAVDMVAFEKEKVAGAVRTDFILSAEIIVIALGTVAAEPFLEQVLVLSVVAVAMTIGVYGSVAGIVKLDDVGLHFSQKENGVSQGLGRFLLWLAPVLMKFLSIAGTAAMFLVGGGILTHGIPGAHDHMHHLAQAAGSIPVVGRALEVILPSLLDGVFGIIAGALILAVVLGIGKLRGGKGGEEAHGA
ncbi:MAG: DUF808 domain-containing protein [Myxococcota bacterium]